MRATLIEKMKSDIETNLKHFLREEGIDLYIAANDNYACAPLPHVVLERIENSPLHGSALLSEIKVILGILGKPWQCEVLVAGIYEALHPHHVTHRELTVLLMSLNVETVHCVRPRCLKNCATMRYIVEEHPAAEEPAANANSRRIADAAKAECC